MRKTVLSQLQPHQADVFGGMPPQADEQKADGAEKVGAFDGSPRDIEEAQALSLLWHEVHANEGEPEALSAVYRTADHQSQPN